jgi:hypothetical protein
VGCSVNEFLVQDLCTKHVIRRKVELPEPAGHRTFAQSYGLCHTTGSGSRKDSDATQIREWTNLDDIYIIDCLYLFFAFSSDL